MWLGKRIIKVVISLRTRLKIETSCAKTSVKRALSRRGLSVENARERNRNKNELRNLLIHNSDVCPTPQLGMRMLRKVWTVGASLKMINMNLETIRASENEWYSSS